MADLTSLSLMGSGLDESPDTSPASSVSSLFAVSDTGIGSCVMACSSSAALNMAWSALRMIVADALASRGACASLSSSGGQEVKLARDDVASTGGVEGAVVSSSGVGIVFVSDGS